MLNRMTENIIKTGIFLICFGAFWIIYILYTQLIPDTVNKGIIQENITEYIVFYNGEEIDGTHINLEDYRVSYDMDKKEVYLTSKPEIRLIPIAIPDL